MIIMYLKKILLLCLYRSFFIGKAQTVVQKDLKDNKEIMPEDHLPINAVLKNGFSYYLKPTCKTDQIELNLIVKAGSNQEKENQFAMAHFMEHMVLKAGKHINLKMRYESDIFREAKINPKSFTAKTELSYTSFKVTIPNNPKALSTIFLFYSDILYDLEFKQEYINSERSPFIDEHDRKGSGTSTAYLDYIVERKLKGSSSTPEDFNDYIWNIDRVPLIDFYKEWYLPENTSLIITGNIGDISQLETKIKHRFSRDSENNITSKTDEIKNFYASSPSCFIKQERKELVSEAKVQEVYWRLYFKEFEGNIDTNKKVTLEEIWLKSIVVQLLNTHFQNISEQYNTHYFAHAGFKEFGALKISIGAPRGQNKKAIQAVMQVINDLNKNGITNEEMNRIKEEEYAKLNQLSLQSSSYWSQKIINHIVDQEPLIADEIPKKQNFLKKLKVIHLDSILGKYLKSMPEDISLITSNANPAMKLKESTVRNWIRKSKTEFYAPLASSQLLKTRLQQKIPDFKLVDYKKIMVNIPNAESYELKNGIKILFKSGDVAPSVYGDENNLRIQGYSSEGAKCFSSKNFYNVINAPDIIKNSGVGDLNKFELKKLVKDELDKFMIHPYINPYESGLHVNTSQENLELTFQIIYLYFTDPNKNYDAFNDWKDGASFRNLNRINQDDFLNQIKEDLQDPYYVPQGSKLLEGIYQTELANAYQSYRQLFGDASNFTFLFSGDFDEQTVLKLCRKYLGNLPNLNSKSNCPKLPKKPINKPKISQEQEYSASGKSDYIRFKLSYLTPINENNDWKDQIKRDIIYRILDYSLMKSLRFDSDKGGPYGIGVGNYQTHQPDYYNEITIDFGARPEDGERLINEAKDVVKSLIDGNLSKGFFDMTITNFKAKKNKYTNKEILKNLYEYTKYGKPWVTIEEKQEYIASLTYDEVIVYAHQLMKEKPYIFKWMPKPLNK